MKKLLRFDILLTQNGNIIISSLVIMGILAITSLGLELWAKQSAKGRAQELAKISAKMVSSTIQGIINNDQAWAKTVQNSSQLDCIRNNTDCCPFNKPSPQDEANRIRIYSADNSIYIDDASASLLAADSGFTYAGRRCDGYNPTTPNENCPFKARVYWNPTLGNLNCQTIQVSIQLDYAGTAILNTMASHLVDATGGLRGNKSVSPTFMRGASAGTLAEQCVALGGVYIETSNTCVMPGYTTEPRPTPGCGTDLQFDAINPKCIRTSLCQAGTGETTAPTFMTGRLATGTPVCQTINSGGTSAIVIPETRCFGVDPTNPTEAITSISTGLGAPNAQCLTFPIRANPGCPADYHQDGGYCYANTRTCTTAEIAAVAGPLCAGYIATWNSGANVYNCNCVPCPTGTFLIGTTCVPSHNLYFSGYITGVAYGPTNLNPTCNGVCTYDSGASTCVSPSTAPYGMQTGNPDPCTYTLIPAPSTCNNSCSWDGVTCFPPSCPTTAPGFHTGDPNACVCYSNERSCIDPCGYSQTQIWNGTSWSACPDPWGGSCPSPTSGSTGGVVGGGG